MTMRMLGVSGELTGTVLAVAGDHFMMDVDGEDFQAKVSCLAELIEKLEAGQTVFIVGRIHFREFDEGHLLVDAQRIHKLKADQTVHREPEASGLHDILGGKLAGIGDKG